MLSFRFPFSVFSRDSGLFVGKRASLKETTKQQNNKIGERKRKQNGSKKKLRNKWVLGVFEREKKQFVEEQKNGIKNMNKIFD